MQNPTPPPIRPACRSVQSLTLGSIVHLQPQPSQRGVALIITLILLGVVTFMAIAFLALSRRERGAVTTVTDTASARLAADAALANAEAQIMANALATTNPLQLRPARLDQLHQSERVFPSGRHQLYQRQLLRYPNGILRYTAHDFLQILANLVVQPASAGLHSHQCRRRQRFSFLPGSEPQRTITTPTAG